MSRRPLLWLAAAWGSGAWLAWRWSIASGIWLALAAGATVIGWRVAHRPRPLWAGAWTGAAHRFAGYPAGWARRPASVRLADLLLLVATASAGGGAWSTQVEQLSTWPGLAYRSQGAVRRPPVTIESELVDAQPVPPHRRPGWQLRLRPVRVGTDAGGPAARQPDAAGWGKAQILVTVERESDPFFEPLTPAERAVAQARPGDFVCSRIELRLPAGGGNPGEFRYATYLARDRVLAVAWAKPDEVKITPAHAQPWTVGWVRRLLFVWRQRVLARTGVGLDWPYAGILRGIFWGDRAELPAAVQETFRRAGASHLLVVSGFNVGLVAAAILTVGRALGWGGLGSRALAAGFVAVYLLLLGPGGSPARAGLMALTGLLIPPHRQLDRLNLLGGAALCLWMLRPLWVFDIGLLLSLAATAGLILGTGPLATLGCRAVPWIPRAWHEAGALSAAAWLSTFPLVWNQFGEISPYGVLTSLAVGPLVGLLLPLAGVRCLAQLLPSVGVIAWADRGLAEALEVGLRMLWWGLQQVAAWPASLLSLPPANPWLLLGTGSLVALGLMVASPAWRGRDPFAYLGVRRGSAGPDPRAWIALSLALALGGPRWSAERHVLSVWFLDVGQGDAALVQAPGLPAVLVDGGPATAANAVREFVHRQVGRGRRIGLVLSHPHSDHEQGLIPLVENGEVAWWVHGVWDTAEQAASALGQATRRGNPPAVVLAAPRQGSWGRRLRWQVFWPVVATAPTDLRGGEWPKSISQTGGGGDSRSLPVAGGNDSSLVFALRYGGLCLLFTGDSEAASQEIWGAVARQSPLVAGAAWHVLKLPHHGAAGAGELLRWPIWRKGVAVVSVGRNSYGQPSQSVLVAAEDRGLTVYRTDQMGAIRLRSDGRRLWVAVRRYDPTQLRYARWQERCWQ